MTGETRGEDPSASQPKVRALPKVATGVAGLDDVLEGGLPEGRTTLVSGGPGTGKTVLALEFVYCGALAGEPGKSRVSGHSNRYHEFLITDRGIDIGDGMIGADTVAGEAGAK
jgi:archaellum biogenesis ATPase FlaH